MSVQTSKRRRAGSMGTRRAVRQFSRKVLVRSERATNNLVHVTPSRLYATCYFYKQPNVTMTPEHIMRDFQLEKTFFVLNRLKNDNRGCFLWVSSGEGDDILRG
jgi:hypothetical protein